MPNGKYRVTLWESERGWGQKPISDNDFDTEAEAQAFYEKHILALPVRPVPDYYIFPRDPKFVDVDKWPPKDYK